MPGGFVHLLPLLGVSSLVDRITFGVGATIIVLGAIGVVISRNPVHAALMLVMTLFGVAVLFVEEGANFLAAVQVIVYAGAIVVLFLFVIMFLGVDREENLAEEPLPLQRPLALGLMVLGIAGLLLLAIGARWSVGPQSVAGPAANQPGGDVAALGRSVFTTYLFAFEITAALLVIAVVGAVVLARRLRPPAEDGPEGRVETSEGPVLTGTPEEADADGDEAGIDSTEAMARAVAETVTSARDRSESDDEEVRS
ncbi:MAG TPA: NADH-quinone oxidoreductase subunit J [Acidimicrobiales bacterium]|nr:NADH-quinone oxidoreductase subunit J [Acidimicrobiales bacterium]